MPLHLSKALGSNLTYSEKGLCLPPCNLSFPASFDTGSQCLKRHPRPRFWVAWPPHADQLPRGNFVLVVRHGACGKTGHSRMHTPLWGCGGGGTPGWAGNRSGPISGGSGTPGPGEERCGGQAPVESGRTTQSGRKQFPLGGQNERKEKEEQMVRAANPCTFTVYLYTLGVILQRQ